MDSGYIEPFAPDMGTLELRLDSLPGYLYDGYVDTLTYREEVASSFARISGVRVMKVDGC